jgi:hypothetical protein
MALLVEIHVPLPADAPGHAPDWIFEVEDFLGDLEDEYGLEVFDDGEQYGEVYVFFIAGASEKTLLKAASRVAKLKGVPAGTFAMVTDDRAGEFGLGRRVDLPVG